MSSMQKSEEKRNKTTGKKGKIAWYGFKMKMLNEYKKKIQPNNFILYTKGSNIVVIVPKV